MNEVFMLPAAFTVKRPWTNSMDPRRYDSDAAELQGIIAEVYECLPNEFHAELENSIPFRNVVSHFLPIVNHLTPVAQFLKQLNSNRRSIIHQFRSSTASEIFGHSTQFYRVQYKREEVAAFQALLKFPTDQDMYPKYPPVLFPDKRQRDMKKLFRSVELTKVRFKYPGGSTIIFIYYLDA